MGAVVIDGITDETGRDAAAAGDEVVIEARKRFSAVERISNLSQKEPPYNRDHGALDDQGLIARLRSAHHAVAAAQAEETTLMAELYRRRRNQDLDWNRNGSVAGEFAAREAAGVLRLNPYDTNKTIGIALALLTRLPLTAEAFGPTLDREHVIAIVDGFAYTTDRIVDLLEERVVEYAETHTPREVRKIMARWIATIDPHGVRHRREQAEAERYVDITPGDGIAHLHAQLPLVGAYSIWERLREMAYTQVCSNDGRTVAQRRADALIALADGTGRLSCRCGRTDCPAPAAGQPVPEPRRALIQVGASDATMLGLADDPGFLAGYGAIDAHLVRLIAQQARFVVIPETEPGDTPTRDTPMAPGECHSPRPPHHGAELVYRPGAALARRIRALDGSCRGPGCNVPASRCDLDHQIPFDHEHPDRGGPTTHDNLDAKCRRHHRLKTLIDNGKSLWKTRTRNPEKRRIEWVTPTGVSIITEPEGTPYLFPHTQPPSTTPPDTPTPPAKPAEPDAEWQWLEQLATPPEKWPPPPDPTDIDQQDQQAWDQAIRAQEEADHHTTHPPQADPNQPPPF